jgi:hypothetical protein
MTGMGQFAFSGRLPVVALVALAGCGGGAAAPTSSPGPSAAAVGSPVVVWCELGPVLYPGIPDDGHAPIFYVMVTDGSPCDDHATSKLSVVVAGALPTDTVHVCNRAGVVVVARPVNHRAAMMYCDPAYTGN